MKKYIYGLLLRVLAAFAISIAFLIALTKKNQKQLTLKNLFSYNNITYLSQFYEEVVDSLPDLDKGLFYNIFKVFKSASYVKSYYFETNYVEKIEKYFEQEKFEQFDNPFLLPLITNTALKNYITYNENQYNLAESLHVSSITFDDNDKIYLIKMGHQTNSIDGIPMLPPIYGNHKKNNGGGRKKHAQNIITHMAWNENFNLEAKLDKFWQHYPNGIYVYLDENPKDTNVILKDIVNESNINIGIEGMSKQKGTLYGKASQDLEILSKRINKFRNNNLQRSYLFVGNPGTGKSAAALKLAENIGNRTIKIAGSLFSKFNKVDIDFVFKSLNPNVVIIDDFDRILAENSEADILYFFESLKEMYKDTTVFCTVNNIDELSTALRRPGRCDEIIIFHLPDEQDREILINSFFKEFSIEETLSSSELRKFINITEGFSHAYIKEFCLQYKYEPDFVELIKRIQTTKQFARITNYRNPNNNVDEEEENYEDDDN